MLHCLTFNGFQENTYLLADDDGVAVVIDPGMSSPAEEATFDQFLRKHNLKLTACWLTHAHIDHVMGLAHVFETYGLQPRLHPGERPVYEAGERQAGMYGIALRPLPTAVYDLEDKASITVGSLTLQQILAPGHSPASICFHLESQDLLIGGDVLFRDSIGRTDLPGGHHQTLLTSIKERIYPLPKQTTVYPGHGPSTTIAYERVNNQFIKA